MKQFKHIKKLISNTPIIEIKYKFENKINYVYAKCEWYSLTGSIKDKAAYQIFYDAYKNGLLKTGDKVVEATSGNMGISICAIANLLNNPVTIQKKKNVSIERKQLLKLYGATVIETNNFTESLKMLKSFKQQGYFCSNQFSNPSNTNAHSLITAKEILKKLKNKSPKYFVSGVGTSGTLIGIGKVLKKKLNLKIIALQPSASKILTNNPPFDSHELQGLNGEFVPMLFNKNIVDNIFSITNNDAIAMSQKLCKFLSLGVGISSGANFLGCVLSGKNAVTVFPDDNKKYLTTNISNTSIKSDLVDRITLLNFKVL